MIISKSLLINELERILLPGLLIDLLKDLFTNDIIEHIQNVNLFINENLPEKIEIKTDLSEIKKSLKNNNSKHINHKILNYLINKNKNAYFPLILSFYFFHKSTKC